MFEFLISLGFQLTSKIVWCYTVKSASVILGGEMFDSSKFLFLVCLRWRDEQRGKNVKRYKVKNGLIT